MADDVIGPNPPRSWPPRLKDGEVMLLENVRFHKEEEKNDPEFAKELASLAEVYVNDAFGTAHRAHASTEGVAHLPAPAVAGFLIGKELSIMGKALEDPARPFVAILGGAKVSDKIGVINNLLDKVDTLIIGGGMSYTFQKALGGQHRQQPAATKTRSIWPRSMMDKAKEKGVKLLLPVDNVCGRQLLQRRHAHHRAQPRSIPDDFEGMDIGPDTAKLFSRRGRERAAPLCGTAPWACSSLRTLPRAPAAIAQGHERVQGRDHHRRRRQRGGCRADGLCRQGDPRVHRRRR